MARRQRFQAQVTASVDVEQVANQILGRALGGLRRTAEFTLGRAKYHAPVRAIFKRRRSERGPEMPRSWRYIRTEKAYRRFTASTDRRLQMNLPIEGGRIEREQAGGSFETSYGRYGEYVSTKAMGTHYKPGGALRMTARVRMRAGIGHRSPKFSGSSNTLFPVFRQGSTKITGDFRQWGGTNEFFKQPKFNEKGERVTRAYFKTKRPDVKSFISARGRYEFRDKTGAGGLPRALFQGRIGGRLRGEIRLAGPVAEGNVIWMYVESPTEYAIHQEYGTKHHRARPFLRPALYESRNVFRTEVRRAIQQPSYGIGASGRRFQRLDLSDSRTSYRKRSR